MSPELNELSESLNDLFLQSIDNTDPDTFLTLAQTYLNSSDPGLRRNVLKVLDETLNTASPDVSEAILSDSVLTLLPLLISIQSDDPALIQRMVDRLLEYSSAKEVIIALHESIQAIEEKLEAMNLSDEEDMELEEPVDEDEIIEQILLILETYTKVPSTLRLTKSTPTLLTLSESLHNLLPSIAGSTDIPSARRLLSSTARLVGAFWTWSDSTSDKGGEQKAILTQVLFLAVTLFPPRVEAKLADRWFLAKNPKYLQLHQLDDEVWKGGEESLLNALSTATALQLDPAALTDKILHPSSTSPHAALASLTLLAATFASASSFSDPSALKSLSADLDDYMPILSVALSSSAIDAGLTVAWQIITSLGINVALDPASHLLELLMPLAAMSPDALSRLLVIKLIAAVIQASKSGETQLILFKQILEPINPFEQIRVQGLSLLRDAVASPDSLVRCPHFQKHLSEILFTIPSISPTIKSPSFMPPSAAPATEEGSVLAMTMDEFAASMWPSWFVETCNLLRMILLLEKGLPTTSPEDSARSTGLKGPAVKDVRDKWVEPQWTKLRQYRSAQSTKPDPDHDHLGIDFLLDRWEDALTRLDEGIKSLD